MSNSLSANFDPAIIESIARSTGFVKRKSPISGRSFLDVLMFNSQQGCQTSLNDLTEDFETHYGYAISKQGLDERFNERGVEFLQQVLSRTIQSTLSSKKLIDSSHSIQSCLVRDSTRFGLPHQYASKYKGHGGATGTQSMISIQYELDLLRDHPAELLLTSGCREVDLIKIYKKLKKHQLPYMELAVLAGKKARIPCRLVVHLAHEKMARHRLKKTAKNTKSIGCKVSNTQKLRTKMELYITNACNSMIHAQNVKEIYGLRWQIELVFKSWKSICNINKVKSMKIERFECMLLAGLIWIMTNWKLFQFINKSYHYHHQPYTCSIWKLLKYTSKQRAYIRAIIFEPDKTRTLLQTLLNLSLTKLYKETKKGKKPYINQLALINTLT